MGIEQILNYFEKQSALANLIQIGGFVYISAIAIKGIPGWIKSKFFAVAYPTLEAYVEAVSKNLITAKSIRTLILDDEPSDYPIIQLCQMGFKVEAKTSISLNEIDGLRSFDVVLLDIRGVLKEDPRTGGLEILKRLKGGTDGPYVIAVSSKGFDPTVAEFFMLANERLKKPIPQADIESVIQRAYSSSLSPIDAARRIDASLGTSNSKNSAARKNLTAIRSYLSGKVSASKLRLQLEKTLGNDVVKKIALDLNIVEKALK